MGIDPLGILEMQPGYDDFVKDKNTCNHGGFIVNANVNRLSVEEGGPITGYTMDIRVKCAECELPFRFKGLSFGSHPDHPTLSVDSTELRAPIEPENLAELLGIKSH